MKKILLIAIALFFITLNSKTLSANDKTITIGQSVNIESKVLEESRTLQIHLPNNYKASSQQYPVLYLLDGRMHFQHASSAVDYLSQIGIIPEMIVVAITNVDRTRDFTPTHVPERPTSGGAEKFINFIETELVPFIEKNYKASPYRILMGHSLGGVFTAYSLCTKPELFNGYIAISPSLKYNNGSMVKLAGEKLSDSYNSSKSFYMTVGDEPKYFEAIDNFSMHMTTLASNSIAFKYEKMPAENHATIPYATVFNGLRFIFTDWQLQLEKLSDGLEVVDEHYKTISEKYHYVVKTPEYIINAIGYQHLQKGDLKKAITIFQENVERNPKSCNVYDSLGEAYEMNNQKEQAKKNYQKAFDLGILQQNPNALIFKDNLERVSK